MEGSVHGLLLGIVLVYFRRDLGNYENLSQNRIARVWTKTQDLMTAR
jgi:hypothetical protein